MMQHTQSHPRFHRPHTMPMTLSKIRWLEIVLFVMALVLIILVNLPSSLRAASPIMGLGMLEQDTASNSGENIDRIATFEDKANQLVRSGSMMDLQTLVQTLNKSEPAAHREMTIALLKNAPPAVVPVLLDALKDPDWSVRAGAAQVLGMRREVQAIPGLINAASDPEARVRRAALIALGDLYAWKAFPRLQQLQATEDNYFAQDAIEYAEAEIMSRAAQEIGVTQLVAISATTSDMPWLYAVTDTDLYVRRNANWLHVSQLPDVPLSLATGSDRNQVYLATKNMGLYWSYDGGQSWEHLQFGLNTPTQITVTAIAIDPHDSNRLYAALAIPGAELGKLNGLGVSVSTDKGRTWLSMAGSPMGIVTTQLVIDSAKPGYLFGFVDDIPWRLSLTDTSLDSQK